MDLNERLISNGLYNVSRYTRKYSSDADSDLAIRLR